MTEELGKYFAILIPDDASLTAPIAAATELSKMFIASMAKVQQFQQETWVETMNHVLENGDEIERTIVHENPRLLEWFKEARRIAETIAKLNSEAETKNIDNKLRIMDMFMADDSDEVKDIRASFIRESMKRKGVELVEDGHDIPVKNKGREW